MLTSTINSVLLNFSKVKNSPNCGPAQVNTLDNIIRCLYEQHKSSLHFLNATCYRFAYLTKTVLLHIGAIFNLKE